MIVLHKLINKVQYLAHVGVFPFSIIIFIKTFLKYCLCIAGQGCQSFLGPLYVVYLSVSFVTLTHSYELLCFSLHAGCALSDRRDIRSMPEPPWF